MTIKEIAEEISSMTGSKSKMDYRPLPQDDPKVRQPDITRARKLLGWEPKVTLEAGPDLDDRLLPPQTGRRSARIRSDGHRRLSVSRRPPRAMRTACPANSVAGRAAVRAGMHRRHQARCPAASHARRDLRGAPAARNGGIRRKVQAMSSGPASGRQIHAPPSPRSMPRQHRMHAALRGAPAARNGRSGGRCRPVSSCGPAAAGNT